MLWHFGSDDSEYSFTYLSSCNNLSVGTVLFYVQHNVCTNSIIYHNANLVLYM